MGLGFEHPLRFFLVVHASVPHHLQQAESCDAEEPCTQKSNHNLHVDFCLHGGSVPQPLQLFKGQLDSFFTHLTEIGLPVVGERAGPPLKS